MRKVTNNGKLIIQLVETLVFLMQSRRLIFHSAFINRELIDTFNRNVLVHISMDIDAMRVKE